MAPFIQPPKHIPNYLKLFIWLGQKISGKELFPAKLLAWFPKGFLASMVLEGLAPKAPKDLDGRILKLVRLAASFILSCPFCIDMNSADTDKFAISQKEIQYLQGKINLNSVETLSQREGIAIKYASLISQTPLAIPQSLVEDLKKYFNEREIVVLALTVAQVNFWSRFIQALGVLPEGFSAECDIQRSDSA
jgi:alkylhydroperoxidase family enzyme